VLLASERKGHILPLTWRPPKFREASGTRSRAFQHIEFYRGDQEEHMRAILRALERLGVAVGRAPVVAPSVEPQSVAATPAVRTADAEALKGSGALAVLPFDNISASQDNDYFSDGLTEELIARLSVVSEIELVSRWASMQFKGTRKDLRRSGSSLAHATSSVAASERRRTPCGSPSSSSTS
jgi:hypothetical protein